VYIEGKIKTRSYDDKDGNKRYITEIVAETFKPLDKRENSGGEGGGGGFRSPYGAGPRGGGAGGGGRREGGGGYGGGNRGGGDRDRNRSRNNW